MTLRSTAIALALSLAGGGCVTTTAHHLVLTGNPLREQAIACEQYCQSLRTPAGNACEKKPGHEGCTVPRESGAHEYAMCLDNCPGARSRDDASCPQPPVPGVICAETKRANAGEIALAAVGIGLAILVIVVLQAVAGLFSVFS